MSRRAKAKITFTQQAADDLNEIYEYSIERWSKRTADKYISDIDAAVQRIQDNPDLLVELPDLHVALRFYHLNKHILICDVDGTSIVVLTVASTYRDIPRLLAYLQPRLGQEVDILHKRARHPKRTK
ncbi:Plasmid stabilization system protein [Bremerella volcania]|uniref:Plasmid stabilization system protein n=1 Tax=Bremerella volcania TaxID=2527984 RepID=A0A518C4B2_9BACT|nr:type II toxin-antitoxin system RelE/ParE family toxin [Bremerella volcania]QDU74055.1 Plasmid stabilization system protein [Bremerella volcania]